MKLMNIVGWNRTPAQKQQIKAKRKARRDAREHRKMQHENNVLDRKVAKRMNRRNNAILNR